ncbi:MAG: sigma-70 family RNA polymerase sigma factor [Kiritimatiellae bacterium]|nr:sigma-70 family RNA polymerase sigma factor [Kiritimatiellia bacterium]
MDAEPRQTGARRREALDALVAAHESALLRYAARLTGNAAAAEDVVQNAFIKLIRHWRDPLDDSPGLVSWLYRVVHNEAVDLVRRELRRQALHTNHAREFATPADTAIPPVPEIPERAEDAAKALAQLSERERMLVALKVYEGKSYREIAEIAGLSSGNVGFILHHAMKKLAHILQAGKEDGRAQT